MGTPADHPWPLRLLSALLLTLCGAVAVFCAQPPPPAPATPNDPLAGAFAPPPQFAADLGEYRSPLRFDDGTAVRTPEDWQRRRAEILRYWHATLGPWPTLLEAPRFEVTGETHRENFIQRRVRVEVAAGRVTEGWLLVPNGRGPFPAVLIPYYEPETSIGLSAQTNRDFARQLTRRGFVTLSIGSPGGDARQPDPGRSGWQPLSFLAYVAANCHTALARLPEVRADQIGIVGHSYGGKWAMFAACLHEPFACAAWSDPGIVFDEARANVNYWEPWYLGADPERATQRQPGLVTTQNPRTGAYAVLRAAGRDLHELQALLAPRPFLVSAGAEDPPSRWQALNHVRAVYELLGVPGRVAMTHREEHTPSAMSNAQLLEFFERFLRPPPR
jgi:dienelactone hydrolase